MALNIEQRIGQKLTNEQYLIWWYLFNTWPNLTFQPLVTTSLADIQTFTARRLFFAYSLKLMFSNASAVQVSVPYAIIYNESNANIGILTDGLGYWDVTAAAPRYTFKHIVTENLWFGRIGSSYTSCFFIGYEIRY